MKTIPILALLGTTFFASACKEAPPTASQPQEAVQVTAAGAKPAAAPIAITVDGAGYHPPSVNAPAGKPTALVFTRTSDEGCGQQLVFPSLNIRKDLPLNKPVRVEFTMPASGSVAFTCGMAMYRGSVVAQ
jgi:plastocyanin domain-containing protein